ncbi:homocysteine S-methyltransferase family protein [Mesorhizobium sp. L-8-3]|uniref:homocysteine S-methyltransferase family protein n=1 Tax=Mesorhizobium sp. L-8-3 TaxID=2744522 RepID=UPI0019274DC1|nr:homocysteine S-methyltransferase family protein [Mesorhizobium sp. L-8-3]BCH25621.1 homocysteine S-methyltransferase [Mesorhizobium sp. L-8-3]
MAKYRHALPLAERDAFLSDGGLETTLIFHEGVDLPHFASFTLLSTQEGRRQLEAYYARYLAIARKRGVGFILDTPTWRANADWGALLDHDAVTLDRVNRQAVTFLESLRAQWEGPSTPCLINGVVGPRGDGYKAGRMEADEAEDYHGVQIGSFANSAADMVSAVTMNTVGEAIGIARAARAQSMPCVVSFTVETDGRLADGTSLQEAIESVDRQTDGSPAYFMINCAHPTHFAHALENGEPWLARVQGVRANASSRSHQELDESTTLDEGDPVDLGRRYVALRRSLPALRVLGGCCGTDHRHIAAICEAVLPAQGA